MDFSKELKYLKLALQQTKLTRITKETVIKEFVTNGVAGIVSLVISSLIHTFFIPMDWKNLDNAKELVKHNWRTKIRGVDDSTIVVDNTTYFILNWIIIFFVGLIVFTIVENFMERYLELRKN